MTRTSRVAAACLIVLLGFLPLTVGCASKPKVLVPPRVDLGEYGAIGIIDFSASSQPEHGPMATRQFVQMLQEAQPGAPILELGSQKQVLAKVGKTELDFEAVRAIGEAYRVDAIFVGDVSMSEVKPNVQFGRSFQSLSAKANINGELSARLMETRAGATVWSRIAESSANVAHVGVPGGSVMPTFGATARGDVEDGLVGQLVANLSGDFSSHWVTE